MNFQGICELPKIVSVSKKVYMVPIYISVHFQGRGSMAVIALSNGSQLVLGAAEGEAWGRDSSLSRPRKGEIKLILISDPLGPLKFIC